MPARRTRKRYTRKRYSRADPRSSIRRRYRATNRRSMKPRVLSKKRILNTSSRKKRDTMLSVTNTSIGNPVGSSTYLIAPAVITADRNAFWVWSPTARSMDRGDGIALIGDEASRTATNVYMRGLKEKIAITTNDACPWFWRRIVFYSKLPAFRTATTGGGNAFSPYFYGSNGYNRMVNQPVNGSAYDDGIWKGTLNKDWNDFITAPVDNRRVDLRYDKTISLNSGAAQGFSRNFNRWHPMNKTLTYDDDENGGAESLSPWSVSDKRGMGDMYIVDIFQSGAGRGTGTTSQLYFRPEATLYWHER